MAQIIRGTMEFEAPAGNVCIMTYHVRDNDTGTSDSTLDAIKATALDWWNVGVGGESALKANCDPNCSLKRVTAQQVRPTLGFTRETVTNIAGTNAGVGSMVAPQLAAVISLRTDLAGRSYRGRMYLPGLDDEDVDSSGLIVAGRQQAIADSAKGFMTAQDAHNIGLTELVVFSRKLLTAERVTAIRVGNRMDIQRRRKIKETSYVVGA